MNVKSLAGVEDELKGVQMRREVDVGDYLYEWLHAKRVNSTKYEPGFVVFCFGMFTWSILRIYYTWWRHQMETFSALLALCVRGIHLSPVNSPHKGQWRRALMFSLICAWIYAWINNREAGDLRRRRAHYDVIVIISLPQLWSRVTWLALWLLCIGFVSTDVTLKDLDIIFQYLATTKHNNATATAMYISMG